MGAVQLIDPSWDEAITIVYTFATIGILISVIFGVLYINIAVRLGYTRFTKEIKQLPREVVIGLLPEDKRESIGTSTTHSMILDTVTWHLALILMSFLGGYMGTKIFLMIFPDIYLSETSLAMISGLIIMFILKMIKVDGTPMNSYIDRKTITKLSGIFGDYLVAFGIAGIDPNMAIKYASPIIILSAIGLIFLTFYLFVMCKRLYHNFWFERGIFLFGWGSGTVDMGMTLLKIVDPEYKSGTIEDYGMAYLIISLFEIGFVTTLPYFVINGYGYISGVICLLIWGLMMFLTAKRYGIQNRDGKVLRPGEKEIIES